MLWTGTAAVLGDVRDERIRYINLPARCGEQSIPSAVGTALARGRFVAYLNHDDLWLPFHLRMALEQMKAQQSPWFVGAAQFAYELDQGVEGHLPVFSDRTPARRCIATAVTKTFSYLEPVSSWVVQTSAVRAADSWRPARTTYRTPVVDLAVRLWRQCGEPTTSDDISVLKVLGSVQGTVGRSYSDPAPEVTMTLRVASTIERPDDPQASAIALRPGRTVDRTAPAHIDGFGFPDRWSRLLGRVVPVWPPSLIRRTGIDPVPLLLGGDAGWL